MKNTKKAKNKNASRKHLRTSKPGALLMATVLVMALVMSLLVGCGPKTAGTVTEPINMAVLNGPTGMAAVQLIDQTEKYNVTTYQAPTDITAKLISGEVDVAALPSNLAAVLYNKTEGQIVAISPIALGMLHILGNEAGVTSIADLKGKTIVASGQGGTPEYVLQKILEASGLTIYEDVDVQWLANHSEVNSMLINQTGTIAMLPEPFVTVAIGRESDINTDAVVIDDIFDLNELWEEATGQELPMGVLVARKSFIEERAGDLEVLLEDLEESVSFVNEAKSKAVDLIVEKGFIANADIAKKAIPGCNIVLYTGEDTEKGKAMLKTFNEILFEMSPASIGGKLAGEDMYY